MSRLSFRPRPLDIHKKLPIVKSIKDFEDDEAPASTRNSQLLRLAPEVESEVRTLYLQMCLYVCVFSYFSVIFTARLELCLKFVTTLSIFNSYLYLVCFNFRPFRLPVSVPFWLLCTYQVVISIKWMAFIL